MEKEHLFPSDLVVTHELEWSKLTTQSHPDVNRHEVSDFSIH